mgnify:CR=1 FL=1
MFRKNNLGDEIDYQNLRRSKEYRPLGEDYRERACALGTRAKRPIVITCKGMCGVLPEGAGDTEECAACMPALRAEGDLSSTEPLGTEVGRL